MKQNAGVRKSWAEDKRKADWGTAKSGKWY